MIVQVRLRIREASESVQAALAYPLYAWLLSQIPEHEGDRLHEQGMRPISQYLWNNLQTRENWWTVNLLNDEAVECFLPVLEKKESAQLHQRSIEFTSCEVERIEDAHVFVRRAQKLSLENRFPLELLTPTSFRQEGRYAIFPQESLILQSLIARWGMCFPEMPLDDPDAMQAMLRGLHIVDYRLQTLRHPLKQTRIPSFIGRVVLEARLPAPLMEVFKTLYCFAPYSGLGVKTALGMGGVSIQVDKEQWNVERIRAFTLNTKDHRIAF